MISTRIATTDILLRLLVSSYELGYTNTSDGYALKRDIAPNTVHVLDHWVEVKNAVYCQFLCCYKDSDEAHKVTLKITHEQFVALPTADEFSRQLQIEQDS